MTGPLPSFSWNHTTRSWTSGCKALRSMIHAVYFLLHVKFFLGLQSKICPCHPMPMMSAALLWAETPRNCILRWKSSTQRWIVGFGKLIWCKILANKNMLFSLVDKAAYQITEQCMKHLFYQEKLCLLRAIWELECVMLEKNQDEVNFCLQVAKRNWARMAHFWHRSFSSKRGKVLVYTALVHSALLSGLETFVLEQSKYKQLNALVLRHGRKLMQGKGCSKQVLEDGSIKYTACKSKAVWKWLRLCPCELELQIRRLAWYQQLARDIHKHKCVLMAIFGKLGFESQDTVDSGGKILPSANAWAQQFSTDIHQGLCKMDAGQGLLDLLQDRAVLVFTEFLPEFLALDMSEIRRTFDPVLFLFAMSQSASRVCIFICDFSTHANWFQTSVGLLFITNTNYTAR